MNYKDVKTKYQFQVIDIRVHIDHINPKKIQLLRNMVQTELMQEKQESF